MIDVRLAPKILRIPISFVRCSMVNAASPNNPKEANSTVMPVKTLKFDASLSSAFYCSLKASSIKEKLKDVFGSYLLYSLHIEVIRVGRLV